MYAAERVLGLAADRGAGYPNGRYRFGSGFLIEGRSVLTCAHAVADADVVLLNDAVGHEYTGHVVHRGDPRQPAPGTGPDLAIVEIDDPVDPASPFPVAGIDRTGMGSLESVRVVGWPRFMDTAGGTSRSTYSAVGTIEEMTRRREGLLRIDVGGSHPASSDPGSPWQGFSGAPVFVDGYLVAVVTTHGLPEGPGALTAIPLPTDQADQRWPVLRACCSSPMHVVRSGPVGPPCVVHHQTVLRALSGYRSNLLYDVMPYVEPRAEAVWHPRNVWQRLQADDGPNAVLVSGHGGIGKTRTLLEVADLAIADGWTVLHVRPGNAAQVVDHLATVARSTFAPVLLVVDYLNQSMSKDLDLPQLLALVQQNRLVSGPHLVVLASARMGWLLTPAHARAVDALEPVRLEPEAEDLWAICAALTKAVAPRATEQLGLDTLLGYTDTTRPILTLLVARQIEDRVTRGLSALPRASMDVHDLRQWLSLRLDEDQLVPRLDSSESLWGPKVEVHIQAAAAVLLATPGTEAELVEAASLMFDDGASASNLLHLLINMGWLISSDGVLDSVHDVVTDFLVYGVVFWSTTGAPRPAMTIQLMDAVSRRPASLEHALVALGRLVDDIDDRDRAADLVGEIDRWFGEHRERVARLLLQDPGNGARTAAVLVSSGMLVTTKQVYWDQAFSPLLTTLGREPEAFSLLLAAVRDLPPEGQDVAAELAEHATAWLTGRPLSGVEQLLRLLLRRDDLPPDRAKEAVRLAVDWLHLHSRDVRSDFLLNAALSCDIVDHESYNDLERLVGFALEWLAANGTQLSASYLLRVVSRVKRLPDDAVGPLLTRALSWLGAHGTTVEASYVLPGFLARAAMPSARVPDFVGAARAWLALHRTRPEATYVLAYLLARRDLDAEVVAETFRHTREWLEQHPDDAAADYLIRRALTHPALPAEVAAVVHVAASNWLSQYGMLETANYLLRASLQAGGLPEELRAVTFATVGGWLRLHGTQFNANYLLQVLVPAVGLPEELRAVTFATVGDWLRLHGTHLSANHLLQVLVPAVGLPEELRALTFATVGDWLRLHGERLNANFLLQVVVPAVGLPEELRAVTFATAQDWLRLHGTHLSANHLLQVVVPAGGLPEELRAFTFACAQDWLRLHGDTLGARYLVEALLAIDGLPAELRGAAFTSAQDWLRFYGEQLNARFLVGALVRVDGLPEALHEVACSCARTWLQLHGGHPDAIHLLQALVPADELPEELRAFTFACARDWLRLHGDTLGARGLIEAFLQVPGLSDELRATTFAWAQHWLRLHGDQPNARYLVEALLPVDGLPTELRTSVFACAQTWLQTYGENLTATFLLQRLVTADGLPEQLRTLTFATAQAWLQAHGEQLNARFLVAVLLDTDAVPNECRQAVVDVAEAWLDLWAQDESAVGVLCSLHRIDLSGRPSAKLIGWTLQWLSERGSTADARSLLALLLRSPALDEQTRRQVLQAAVDWLTEQADSTRAAEIVSRVLDSPDAPETIVVGALDAARIWLGRRKISPFRARFLIVALLRRQAQFPDRVRTILSQLLPVLEGGIDSAQARFALAAFHGEAHLDNDVRETVLRLTREWLTQFAGKPFAHVVLAPMATRGDLTADEQQWFEGFVWSWLESNAGDPLADSLARALLEGMVSLTPELHGKLVTIAAAGPQR